jgi:hypothetical protein
MLQCWPNLVELRCASGARRISNADALLETLAKSCPNLRALLIRHCIGLTKEVSAMPSN